MYNQNIAKLKKIIELLYKLINTIYHKIYY